MCVSCFAGHLLVSVFVYVRKGFALATQSWQPPAPRKSTDSCCYTVSSHNSYLLHFKLRVSNPRTMETGWSAAPSQIELVIAS